MLNIFQIEPYLLSLIFFIIIWKLLEGLYSGEFASLNSWIITLITLIILAVFASILFEKKKNKIAYWA